jgi:hypothetical protein
LRDRRSLGMEPDTGLIAKLQLGRGYGRGTTTELTG